jgi:hypothetical protein
MRVCYFRSWHMRPQFEALTPEMLAALQLEGLRFAHGRKRTRCETHSFLKQHDREDWQKRQGERTCSRVLVVREFQQVVLACGELVYCLINFC